jgi:hypothetical protein
MTTLGAIFELLTLGLPPVGLYGIFLTGIVGVGLWLEIREAWEPNTASVERVRAAGDPAAEWKPAPSGA